MGPACSDVHAPWRALQPPHGVSWVGGGCCASLVRPIMCKHGPVVCAEQGLGHRSSEGKKNSSVKTKDNTTFLWTGCASSALSLSLSA